MKTLETARKARMRRRLAICTLLGAAVVALYVASLIYGEVVYSPADVWAVIVGRDVPGASFAVGELRLPRATLAVLAGAAYGVAGTVFQTMLRNQLASPDVIGINAGASAAGVIGIVLLRLSETAVSLLAMGGALAVALAIYALSYRKGFAGTRLILVGIGMTSMLGSVIAYVLSKAATWDMPTATRWLTGSLNGASWAAVLPVALTCAVALPAMLLLSRDLALLRLGDDSAAGLGVNVSTVRFWAIVCAVALVAASTSACGPIAFVAFMSCPIASRLVGAAGSLLAPSALVGATIVLASDFAGQWLFGTRYPAGVITGIAGAPYLIFLLVRSNRSGASL